MWNCRICRQNWTKKRQIWLPRALNQVNYTACFCWLWERYCFYHFLRCFTQKTYRSLEDIQKRISRRCSKSGCSSAQALSRRSWCTFETIKGRRNCVFEHLQGLSLLTFSARLNWFLENYRIGGSFAGSRGCWGQFEKATKSERHWGWKSEAQGHNKWIQKGFWSRWRAMESPFKN